jgi:hypothetical protein
MLLPLLAAGCGSHKKAVTIDGVKSCLVDAGFLVRGEGRPGAGDALAVRTGEKRLYAFAVVALFDTESAARSYANRFTKVLARPPRNPDAAYLETLLRRRGTLVYGWTTRPPARDIHVLDRCVQPR